MTTPGPHAGEAHTGDLAARLNWLRAGVLGANDGIVSTASIVVGVAGASTSVPAIATAGIAALVGGAVSMALGEYVSVSSQKDSQRALIEQERRELHEDPVAELEELTQLWEARGLRRETAEAVAAELTDRDALRAHLTRRERLGQVPERVGVRHQRERPLAVVRHPRTLRVLRSDEAREHRAAAKKGQEPFDPGGGVP
ncbi:VIT1/CCC1 transporter family protein [Curtobacterium sp. B18]|uniref:VIT1/CCC1 transporter family protein n=1 Tax=Curtobacterium sp. B18 TaxID=95614 RepID=UPI000344ACFB|nr:VIT1/CCC1 transporter family protein [Curtobacterium sp. B18]